MTIASYLQPLGRLVLDTLLPPRCLSCGQTVGAPGSLCGTCWEGVRFIGPPMCRCCGFPFELDPGPDSLCGACLQSPPAFDRARSVVVYDSGSRDLVLAFKHADRTEATPAFARWMHRAGSELFADAEVIVPVPLHRWRLFRRRYNQSALLANALGDLAGLTVIPDLLVRRRNTPSQGYLSPAGRRRNVAGAFQVNARHQARAIGQRVLLVDDVLTTGATAAACAKALRRAGATGVDVLVLARVVRPSQAQ